MFDLQIDGARIITSTGSFEGCISIQDGKISALTKSPIGGAKQTINAYGLIALPGMIDEHIHFMDPGENEREDFIYGSKAAVMAGVTTVIEHSHCFPIKNLKDFNEKKAYVEKRSFVDFGLAVHAWPGYFEELPKLWEAGAAYFKMFTCTTHGVPGLKNDELFNTFSKIASFGGRILIHCEDDALTAYNEAVLKQSGRTDDHIFQEWRSKEAEEIAVANVLCIAGVTGARVIIAHATHPKIVEMIIEAKKTGARVYAETCPQYLFLDEDALIGRGSFGKFTPPSRTRAESLELFQMLINGSIDILASDHAPSTKLQKSSPDIWNTPFGLPGIDTTGPLMLNAVFDNKISLERFVQVYSVIPAKILGLYPVKGEIAIGSDADIVLLDPGKKWTISDEKIKSKVGWTPYHGTECKGQPLHTIVRGQVVMRDGNLTAEPGLGKLISRV